MDGAMGSEIQNRGFATTTPLWSAEVLFTNPQIVKKIHEDNISAGAEIIITDTFRTTKRAFEKKGLSNMSRKFTLLACKLALEARKKHIDGHEILIAGSVAPLEDCYSPELTPSKNELNLEHEELLRDLKEGGVDFILLETMITLRETLSGLQTAKKLQIPVAVSFCVNSNYQLLSGESLKTVVKKIEPYQPLFIGINCIVPEIATKTIPFLRKITKFPISVYAQGDGGVDDAQGWKMTKEKNKKFYLDASKEWVKAGVKIVGGCCGTTPDYIKELNKVINLA